MGFSIDNITARLDEENNVKLDVKITVGELNEKSYIGYFHNLIPALNEAVQNQKINGDFEGAKTTQHEIDKMVFWKMLGVTMGSVYIEDGKLYGLSNKIDLDESLQKLIHAENMNKEGDTNE
jgi:hypothetical protein